MRVGVVPSSVGIQSAVNSSRTSPHENPAHFAIDFDPPHRTKTLAYGSPPSGPAQTAHLSTFPLTWSRSFAHRRMPDASRSCRMLPFAAEPAPPNPAAEQRSRPTPNSRLRFEETRAFPQKNSMCVCDPLSWPPPVSKSFEITTAGSKPPMDARRKWLFVAIGFRKLPGAPPDGWAPRAGDRQASISNRPSSQL